MIYAFLKSAFAPTGRRLVHVFTRGAATLAPGYALIRLSACYSCSFVIPVQSCGIVVGFANIFFIRYKHYFNGEEDFAATGQAATLLSGDCLRIVRSIVWR